MDLREFASTQYRLLLSSVMARTKSEASPVVSASLTVSAPPPAGIFITRYDCTKSASAKYTDESSTAIPPRGCQLAGIQPGAGGGMRPFSRPFTKTLTVPSTSEAFLISLPTVPSALAGPSPSSSQKRNPLAIASATTACDVETRVVDAPPDFGTCLMWNAQQLVFDEVTQYTCATSMAMPAVTPPTPSWSSRVVVVPSTDVRYNRALPTQ